MSKLLIVGESHYKWEDDEETSEEIESYLESNDFTRATLDNYLEKQDKKLIYSNTERAILLEQNPTIEQKSLLWSSVAFYNFIQRYVADRKERPSVEDFGKGWEPFFKVIEILKPDYCLFCGVRSSDEYGAFLKTLKNNDYKIVNEKKTLDNIGTTTPRIMEIKDNVENKCKLLFIKHPSMYFSWEEWGNLIKEQFGEISKSIK